MTASAPFKICPCCRTTWGTVDEFIDDRTVTLNGYKADLKDLEFGLFFFTHTIGNCGSTMAFEVNDFLSLFSGEQYIENKALSPECPRYCIDEKQLARCDALCECAFVREVSQIIRDRHIAAMA